MKLQSYLYAMRKLHQVISAGQTGTPEQLAEWLGVSVSTLYNYLNIMKDVGAPIIYDRKAKTYRYQVPVDFVFGFKYSDHADAA